MTASTRCVGRLEMDNELVRRYSIGRVSDARLRHRTMAAEGAAVTARILDITAAEYHALPNFSASTAKILLAQSALHAKSKLGKDPSKRMDMGGVCHHLLLGKGAEFAVLPFDDMRTKAAKESRDKSRAAGLIPITHVDHTEYEHTVAQVRKSLDAHGYFISPATGRSEMVVEWTENTRSGPIRCKCMIDHAEGKRIYEVKFVEDASPAQSERTAENLDYALSAAAYIRGYAALHPEYRGEIEYRFLFCETQEPWSVYAPEPDGIFLESGETKWLTACDRWARCVRDNDYPGYQANGYISRPQWAIRREGYMINE